MKKIVIDTGDNLLYKSFYIYALEHLYGKHSISYYRKPFANLNNRDTRGFAFIIDDNNGTQKKYYIQCNDTYQINEEFYNWCDVYGHCNANLALTQPHLKNKLVPLCPSFAIKCWNFRETFPHFIESCYDNPLPLRKIAGQHKRMLQRCSYDCYTPSISQDDYIFFLSTLWYNDEWNNNDTGVNLARANFIRAVKHLQSSLNILKFEGGLVPQSNKRSSELLFEDCIADIGEVPNKIWIEKTKRSSIVFNTPAFLNCHGWKLGEYLALGKAIISTELYNDLPAPLTHGVNIHFVDNNQQSIEDAVLQIISTPEYRHRLEKGAIEYWNKYGRPTASLNLLDIN